ncbi:MAG TPA: hypothetical protein DEB06_07405 [Phycisphaerales bacterium]|nr:hypothetical protein [Phycisphaerales bacterium]
MAQNEMQGITGDILLDAGTNEFEVLVFLLAGGAFGLNVAKVREVIKPVALVATPHRHPSVLGMFNIRGTVLPVVDLSHHLGLRDTRASGGVEGRIIITEFNGLRTGFLVDAVEQIHRMSWSRVKPAPDFAFAQRPSDRPVSSTTGSIDLDGRLVLLVDFESVADSIMIEKRLHIGRVANPRGIDRGSKRVILAEDSPFMRRLMGDVLRNSGYGRLEVYSDGQAAWEAIDADGAPISAIVSDIEMPRMDGLALTRKIKGDARFARVPVVLFSSLVSEDNLKKGRQVGADVQIPKPRVQDMVELVDRAVSGESIEGVQRVVPARAA